MSGYEKAQDHYDSLMKGVHYLLIGHAAGLLACLTALKDYFDHLNLKGIGCLILLFGGGLIATVLLWILSLIGRMELLAAIQLQRSPPALVVFYHILGFDNWSVDIGRSIYSRYCDCDALVWLSLMGWWRLHPK